MVRMLSVFVLTLLSMVSSSVVCAQQQPVQAIRSAESIRID